MDFSRAGKPTDNALVESFNDTLRDECLNINWFLSMEDARGKIERWRVDYNEFRPHSSLGDLTPQQFAEQNTTGATAPGISTFGRSSLGVKVRGHLSW